MGLRQANVEVRRVVGIGADAPCRRHVERRRRGLRFGRRRDRLRRRPDETGPLAVLFGVGTIREEELDRVDDRRRETTEVAERRSYRYVVAVRAEAVQVVEGEVLDDSDLLGCTRCAVGEHDHVAVLDAADTQDVGRAIDLRVQETRLDGQDRPILRTVDELDRQGELAVLERQWSDAGQLGVAPPSATGQGQCARGQRQGWPPPP